MDGVEKGIIRKKEYDKNGKALARRVALKSEVVCVEIVRNKSS